MTSAYLCNARGEDLGQTGEPGEDFPGVGVLAGRCGSMVASKLLPQRPTALEGLP